MCCYEGFVYVLLRRVPAGRGSQSPGQYHLRIQRGKVNISSLFLPTSMHVLYVIVLSTFMHDIPGAADDLTKPTHNH